MPPAAEGLRQWPPMMLGGGHGVSEKQPGAGACAGVAYSSVCFCWLAGPWLVQTRFLPARLAA